MIYSEELLNRLHRLSYANRPLVERSTVCGCFYCGAIYSPDIIDPETDYCIDLPHDTATCPYCWIDSVICDAMDVEITPELLEEMYQEFFERTVEDEDDPFSGVELEAPDEGLQRVQFPCNGAPGEGVDEVCAVVFRDGSRMALKDAPLLASMGVTDMNGVTVVRGFPSGTGVVMYVTLLGGYGKIVRWDYQADQVSVADAGKTHQQNKTIV